MPRIILCTVLIFCASVAWSDDFGLRVTIKSGGLTEEELNARLHYALERPSPNLVPVSESMTIKNDERNQFFQFVFKFDDLEFSPGATRGFFWGEIEDTDGNILRRIPLTTFAEADLSDRNLLVQSVGTRKLGISALAESYPIYLADSSFLDTKNVLFSLQAVRTLIDAGFVSTASEWLRIFDKFTTNVDFFRRGGADDVGLILRYLHERYEILIGTDATIDIYSKFYFRFLTRLMELDIGGLAAPDGSRLDAYAINRMRQMIGDQGALLLEEGLETQAAMIRMRNAGACLQISQEMLVEINADQAFWGAIQNAANNEQNVKVFLKRFVDCAQRHYVQGGDNKASMILFDEGFASLLGQGEFGERVMTVFFATVQKLESAGLFRQTQRNGPYQQVYLYFDLAIKEMGF